MHFPVQQKILFRHCDPAGIVFYPRYVEMLNDTVEQMFCTIIGWPFEDMHPDHSAPTAALNIEFRAPSHHGDCLDIALTIIRLGPRSMTVTARATCAEELRFEAQQTLVCVDETRRSCDWPQFVRDAVGKLPS